MFAIKISEKTSMFSVCRKGRNYFVVYLRKRCILRKVHVGRYLLSLTPRQFKFMFTLNSEI